jgi:hypothetical protein
MPSRYFSTKNKYLNKAEISIDLKGLTLFEKEIKGTKKSNFSSSENSF